MEEQFELAYGHSVIRFSMNKENLLGTLQADSLSCLDDPVKEILKGLKKPIESLPLAEIVSPGERVGLVVPDKTRISQSSITIPVIIEELQQSEISLQDIFILFANGTHPFHTKKEQEAIVGSEVASKIKLSDHDCRDERNLKYVGTTTRGTRVKLNKQLLEADRIILTGVISYHYFAGFGGGRKSILPGVSAFETIQTNHKLVLGSSTEAGMNEMARTANLIGNPIHEDMEEAALMANPDFLVNVVLSDDRKIAGVFAGDLIMAHRKGCDFLDGHYRVGIDELADVVIVGCGGYPKDINFVQSHKAMDNAAYALKEGGTMVLVAEAAEGFSSPVYEQWIDLKTLDRIEQELRRDFSIPGHTVYAAMEKAEKFDIIWVSKQDPEKVKKMGITPTNSVEEALTLVQKKFNNRWKAYLIPDGYVTLPSANAN